MKSSCAFAKSLLGKARHLVASRLRQVAAVWLGVVLIACGGGGGDGGGQVSQPPAPVTQTVGAAGGTINGPSGIVLDIPAGALATDTAITIALDGSGAPAQPSGNTAGGALVSLAPHGTTFGLPVTLTLPFDPASVPPGRVPMLVKTNPSRDGWQQLVTERDGNTLKASATGFSWIGVFCCIDPIRIVAQPADQTAPEGGFAFFRVEAVGYDRNSPPHVQWLRNGLPMPGETNQELLIPRVTLAHDNTLYTARVGFTIFEDSRAARLLVTPAAPRVVNQPLDLEVVAGQRATFNAASTSSVAQALQWQRTDSGGGSFSDLLNETATQLSFNALDADHNRLYRMCATNAGGTTCSRGARLSVIPRPMPPAIVQQPQAVSTAAGNSATFTVQAAGGALTYEWHTARAGGGFTREPRCTDSATCTLSSVALGDDGLIFRVLVSNSAGSALSAEVLLTVRVNPGAVLSRVASGGGYTLGLRANGTLRAWGTNGDGQLGDGTFDTRDDAVDVIGLADVATFAAGYSHALAIRANGEVWSWGGNRAGQLGDGTTADRATPQPVPALGAARAVAAGNDALNAFSLAVLADGTVRAWGDNTTGQLGDGTATDRLAPVRVGTLTDVASVAAGSRHALALRRDGTVWAWGANDTGQLGNGTTTASLTPVPVALPERIVAIAAGYRFSLALTETGNVLAWGYNISGELGDGTTERRLLPVAVVLPAPAIGIAASWGQHTLALLADGRVFAWGANFNGQCGFGTDTIAEPTPRQVIAPLPPDVVAIGIGANHSLALDARGNVWAWGNNSAGQLNDGTRTQRDAPVLVRNVNLN